MDTQQRDLLDTLCKEFPPVFIALCEGDIQHVLFSDQKQWFILTKGSCLGIPQFPLMMGMAGLCVQKNRIAVRAFHQIGLGWNPRLVKEGVQDLLQEYRGEQFIEWSKKGKTTRG